MTVIFRLRNPVEGASVSNHQQCRIEMNPRHEVKKGIPLDLDGLRDELQ